MSFSSGQSRLIELPPEARQDESLDESAWDSQFFEATTHQDLIDQLGLDDELAHRILLKGELFGNYQILKFIGQGGMSDVYVARHLDERRLSTRRPVALKILRDNQHANVSLLTLLEREAEICHTLKSSHVVRIYEYGLSQTGQAFMALELLIGEELFELRKARKMIPIKQTIDIACQVLAGLEAIHAQGVVHRDLKTENIFLVKEHSAAREVVKIIDLGLARYIGDDPGDPLLLDPQQLWGTPHYLSPEQTKSPVVDHRSDLYSMGIILYECLTGAYPFDGDTPYAIMHAHQNESPPMLPSTIDHELAEIVYKALAKKPEFRWQSAREMREALEMWIANTSWVNGLPGLYDDHQPNTQQDGLFAQMLSQEPDEVRDSGNLLPVAPIDRFQRATPGALRQTPLLGEFNEQAQQALRAPQRFDEERSLFEEQGVAPPSAIVKPAKKPNLKRSPSGSQPALRMPDRSTPLHSSPIELAQTKPRQPAPPREPVVSQPLSMPQPKPLEETTPSNEGDGKMVIMAMLLLGLSLIVALVLLLIT